jgi:serine/threonine-protein kinase
VGTGNDDAATQVLGPGRAAARTASPPEPADPTVRTPAPSPVPERQTGSGHGSGHGATRGATTLGSPLEALESDELTRSRWFCFIGLAIALAGFAAVVVLPGDPTASAIVISADSVAIVAIGFLYQRTRDRVSFRRPSTMFGWFIPAACITSAIPFFGPFSPVSLVLVLGVYFTGQSQSARLAYWIYAICAGAQAICAGLVMFGGMHDPGLVQADLIGRSSQLVIQGLVQIVMLGAIVTARISRRSALAAFGELERAVRVATQREALLLEAREELERALRAGRGRFSDQTIGGYQLGPVIGRGAMGEVYEAIGPDGAVAIKLLSQSSLGNPDHVLRFLRELRTAAQLVSPYIVRVLDVGERPLPYLVMERLSGKTLSELLRERRVLSPPEVIDLIAQIGAGITAAAQAGVVHRDLKPQNVFRHGGTWKILDFGIARAIDGGDTLTAGQIIGTPSYMAPEQASGNTVDHRGDLYALAAIAYRALTGQPPFVPGEIAETLYRVVHTAPRRPTELARLPPAIDLVLAVGLAKDPAARFASAEELAAAIAAAFSGEPPHDIALRGRALVRAGAWQVDRRAVTSGA